MRGKGTLKNRIGMLALVLAGLLLTGCQRKERQEEKPQEQQEEQQDEQQEVQKDEQENSMSIVTAESQNASMIVISPSEEKIKWAIYSEGYYCYGNGSLCGYLSEDGKEITPCIYAEAMPFSEGLACVCLDGKYGYIGKDGETVLPFIYDQAASFSEGVAYFSRGEEYGLMDREGNVVLELTDCDSISSFREELAYFSVDGQYGYMDQEGRIVIQPVYDDAGYFYDGRAVVMKDGFGGVIGKDGREILPTEYIGIRTEDECIIAQKEDSFCVFDKEGNAVSAGAWDRIYESAWDNIFYIYQGDRIGFLDRNGKIIMEPVYEYMITPIPEKELVIVRNEEGAYGVLDYSGEIRVPYRYSEISYQREEGGLRVTDADTGKAGYLDGEDFSERIPLIYDSLQYFTEDRVVAQLGEKYGVVRYDGTLSVPVVYDRIMLYADGAMALWTGETVELTDRQGHSILKGAYTHIWKCGNGYGAIAVEGGYSYWDSQGRLTAQFETSWSDPVYGAKNSTLHGGMLFRYGEEKGECPEEFVLTNQITPKAGLFKDFLRNGSITADTGGPEFTVKIASLMQGRRFSKLYRMGEEDIPVLYFYAGPLEQSNFAMSDSGWFLIRDGQVEQIAGASECGGSLRGDWACFWYDEEEKTWKPGTSGIWGGWPGRAYTDEIYHLENGEAVLENSFMYRIEYAEDEDDEKYYIDDMEATAEAYYAARERYRYYMPLDCDW